MGKAGVGKCTISAGGSVYVQNNNTNVTPSVMGLVLMTVNNFSSVAHLQNIQRAAVGKTENKSKPKVSYQKVLIPTFISRWTINEFLNLGGVIIAQPEQRLLLVRWRRVGDSTLLMDLRSLGPYELQGGIKNMGLFPL